MQTMEPRRAASALALLTLLGCAAGRSDAATAAIAFGEGSTPVPGGQTFVQMTVTVADPPQPLAEEPVGEPTYLWSIVAVRAIDHGCGQASDGQDQLDANAMSPTAVCMLGHRTPGAYSLTVQCAVRWLRGQERFEAIAVGTTVVHIPVVPE